MALIAVRAGKLKKAFMAASARRDDRGECCPREALRLSTSKAHARMGGMSVSTKRDAPGRAWSVLLRVLEPEMAGDTAMCGPEI